MTQSMKGRQQMPETAHPYEARVRATLDEHARLPVAVESLQDYDDLFQAGMTSHASVNVMLALEEEFDIEFPEEMLQKSTFESIEAICTSLASLATIGDPV
jgi:acyl carrier protein